MSTGRHPVQIRYSRPTRHVAARSLDAALAAINDPELAPARIVAGATDLLLEIDRGARRGIATLVDISQAPGLDAIVIDGDMARLGPLVTHRDVVRHPVLVDRALPLAQACREVGSPQLRNRATVVGNLVTASPANDTISALLALGASVELRSPAGTRILTVEEFVTGFRTTALADGELVTGLTIPLLGAGSRGMFVKVSNRAAQAISVVHIAAVIELDSDGRTVATARIALGSVAPTVVLAPTHTLIGRALTPESIDAAVEAAASAVTPIDDVRATAGYRSEILRTVLRRTLRCLADERERERWDGGGPTLCAPATSESSAVGVATVRTFGEDDVVTVQVDGVTRTATGACLTLLDWLRDRAGVRAPKEGCAEGECGACTVVLDGRAVMSCLVPAARADGSTVTTVAGLADDAGLHPLQQAFVDCGAAQCGFCTPGFLVAGAQLLGECPDPTDDDIRAGLGGNLCRCTGYRSITDAVAIAAASRTAARSGR